MRLYFTRPSLHDCLLAGIERCTAWLEQPQFDATPKGAADPAFPAAPRGWGVRDEYGAAQGGLSAPLRKLLAGHDELAQALFCALAFDIDGNPDTTQCYARWTVLLDDAAHDDTGKDRFLLALDVPPVLWWTIARHIGDQAAAFARHPRLLQDDAPV